VPPARNGIFLAETDETVDTRFFSPDELPVLEPYHLETLEDLKNFTGQMILK